MIDNRLLALLGKLVEMPQFSLTELSALLQKRRRDIETDIIEINRYLKDNDLSLILINNDRYLVPEKLIQEFKTLSQLPRNIQIFLSEEERIKLIYLVTFVRKNQLSNFHYQEFLQVSKNTALNDVKKLRKDCTLFDLNFSYSRKKGYFIQGNEINKRKMAFSIISKLLESTNGKWIVDYLLNYWGEENNLKVIINEMKEKAKQYSISLVEDRLNEIAHMIILVRLRNKPLDKENERYKNNISSDMEIYQYCKSILEDLIKNQMNQEEIFFLSSLLMSIAEGNSLKDRDRKLYKVTSQVVNIMEALSLVSFESKDKLINTLYIHMVPAYYRLIFEWRFKNGLTEQVKKENQELFNIVSRALTPLREIVETEITDDEIAYFVIHFGGQLEKQLRKQKKYRALIVCPNGISSSLILKAELQQLFPEFTFLQNHSVDDFKKVAETEYDMVFSTVYISTQKPAYIVKPVMEPLAKNQLIQKVTNDFALEHIKIPNIENLLKVIRRNATIHDEKKLYKELFSCLLEQENIQREELPVLEDLLTEDYIKIQKEEEVNNWKEAISLACQPLINKGNIEPSYIESIFSKVEEYGPFIDLGQGVAIPHARPEDGVKELGMSFLKLKNPVYLLDDENHKIELIITLAAIDNETHLKALSQLTKILSDKVKLSQLKKAADNKEVLELIKEKGV
ncbi:BglG family transcription antiterminator [Marinilactibacillus piezotolerans]|uniref:BglG family transcription antiterminator n=1 Tax=Marinilactibacillus piezotolerans TaxID=258723 RepID=UPI0015C4A5C8|nr:BglG family transcription antiterminator [Marinilactibacillus piezotolerans]